MEFSSDEYSLLHRGLVSLHNELEVWNKKKTGWFSKTHDHESHVSETLELIENLSKKLNWLELESKLYNNPEGNCTTEPELHG